MGIVGLLKFMKINGCCEQVRLSDIADSYRNKTGKDPVLLVDYSSTLMHFYTSSPGIITVSGELKKFQKNWKTFVNNCEELGIQLKIFADGRKPAHKYGIWIESITTKLNTLKEIYSGQTNTCSDPLCRSVLFWVTCDFLLLKDNCKFSRAIYEADDSIIQCVKAEDCFAILSHDSDYIMLDNVHYCLTPDNSDLQSMIFLNFNRSKLAKLLNINASQFPLFASLCLVNNFQCSDLLEIYKLKEIKVNNRFFGVADLIKNFTSKEELVQNIFSPIKPMLTTNVEKRLKFYTGDEKEKEKDERYTEKNHWGEIIKFAEERHTTGEAHHQVLSTIQAKEIFIGPTCNNVLNSLHENALLTFRKKIYGILFFEYPNSLIFVTEFSYECLQEEYKRKGRTVIVERRSHPGLLKLWSQENSSSLKTARQTVFCETINDKLTAKDFSSLNIPLEYVFPILAMFYFLWEIDERFEFEVEVILIQAILVNRLTDEQIDQLPEEFHLEALNLTAWFLDIIDCLYFLNSICGEPFCRYKTNVIHFFDGKVMQYVYGKMKERENPWTCFSQYQKEYTTLISALYQLGRICGHVEPKEKLDSLLNEDTTN